MIEKFRLNDPIERFRLKNFDSYNESDPLKPENNPLICFTTNTYETYLEDRHNRSKQRGVSTSRDSKADRYSSVSEYNLRIYCFVVFLSALILFAIGFSFMKKFQIIKYLKNK